MFVLTPRPRALALSPLCVHTLTAPPTRVRGAEATDELCTRQPRGAMNADFTQTTHAKHWTFKNAEAIDELRRTTHEAAVVKLATAASSSSKGGSTSQEQWMAPPREDIDMLFIDYQKRLQGICRKENRADESRFTDRVLCTAQHYFKRFYLHVSPMEEDPKGIMLAAIYLAGKVEEERIQIGDLVPKYWEKCDKDALLALEQRLLETLRFQLVVRSPFRCLTGLLQDLYGEISSSSSAAANEELNSLLRRASTRVAEALISDAPLLYAPQQVALAALLSAAKEVDAAAETDGSSPKVGGVHLHGWIKRRFSQSPPQPQQHEALMALLSEVERVSGTRADLTGKEDSIRSTGKKLSRISQLLKRVEKANKEKRAQAERERLKRSRDQETEAETAKLAAQVEEARALAKQEMKDFEIRKRVKSEAPS